MLLLSKQRMSSAVASCLRGIGRERVVSLIGSVGCVADSSCGRSSGRSIGSRSGGSKAVASMCSFSSSSKFYGVGSASEEGKGGEDAAFIRGFSSSMCTRLANARPGDVIEVPYEVTVDRAFLCLWFGAFYNHDRIHTSTPFARKLGLQDQVGRPSLLRRSFGLLSVLSHGFFQTIFANPSYHLCAAPRNRCCPPP